jgi:signal transduction histidine kinase
VGLVRDARGQQWLYVARAFGPDRILVVAGPPKRFAAAVFFGEYLLLPLAEAAAVAAVLAMILAVIIARSIANPLHNMAAAAQGIARGGLNTPAIPVAGPDEVRSLGEALNHMTGQLQSTQQAQRDFLANVSHELRTPLTSIQGFAQAMLDGAAATPEAIQRSAGIIYGEADRMRRLVDGLLDLARLDSGLRALNLAPLDLHSLLASAAEKFSLRAGTAGITLTTDLPPSLAPITGDADRLGQVVANLLDNALKHTPAGGRVTLSAAASPASVEISVSDTGPGIPAEDLARIFERFYQVDKSRARSSGLGLGLAISREIVEAHGGRLRAESVTGLGSRFTVQLPLPASADATARGKSKRGEPQ